MILEEFDTPDVQRRLKDLGFSSTVTLSAGYTAFDISQLYAQISNTRGVAIDELQDSEVSGGKVFPNRVADNYVPLLTKALDIPIKLPYEKTAFVCTSLDAPNFDQATGTSHFGGKDDIRGRLVIHARIAGEDAARVPTFLDKVKESVGIMPKRFLVLWSNEVLYHNYQLVAVAPQPMITYIQLDWSNKVKRAGGWYSAIGKFSPWLRKHRELGSAAVTEKEQQDYLKSGGHQDKFLVMAALMLLNHPKITVEKQGLTDAQNRHRVKVGREPLSTYYVLKIPAELHRHRGESMKAWNNRLHSVRGHHRQLQTGKRVWVRNHKRGTLTLGQIIKDYEVTV